MSKLKFLWDVIYYNGKVFAATLIMVLIMVIVQHVSKAIPDPFNAVRTNIEASFNFLHWK